MPKRFLIPVIILLATALSGTGYYLYSRTVTPKSLTWQELVARHPNEIGGESESTVYHCDNDKDFLVRAEFAPHGGGDMEVFLRDGTKMLLTQRGTFDNYHYANSGGSFVFRSAWIDGRTVAHIEEGPVVSYANCSPEEK